MSNANVEDDTRYHAMVEFLGTFSTLSGQPPEQLADLSDGVTIFEALSEIAPDYFDPTTIARHLGDNWALKSSNLRKLVRNLEHYYHEALEKDADFSELNLARIARQADPEMLAHLVELVAAAAVTCGAKGTYVSRIMNMTPEAQVEMKGILESSLSRLIDFDADEESGDENELVFGSNDDADSKILDDYDEDEAEDGSPKNLFGSSHYQQQDDLEQALQDARRELSSLKSQKTILEEDNDKAQSKLRALVEDLQDRLVKRQDDLTHLEEELQNASSELQESRAKIAEMQEEKARLADDLDVANAKAQQLHKAEATVLAYKKKLEGVGVMNQQMTDLEDQAANYVRQIMELEAEVKKSEALQKTVESLQEKIAKLEKDKSVNDSSSKTSATEIADLKSRLTAAESAKKMYEEELTELRARQENGNAVDVDVEGFSVRPQAEQREKFMRMEIENENLKKEVEKLKFEMDSSIAVAATAVSASSPAKATSDAKSESTPMAVAVSADDTTDMASLKADYQRLKVELAAKEKENAKISSDKDKLEAYTKRTLAKFQDKYLVALQECKAKLKEKQDKIEALEIRSQSERTAQKREERLMSSTIYELGLAIMQNRLKER